MLTCRHGLPHPLPVHVFKQNEDGKAKYMEAVENLLTTGTSSYVIMM